MLIGQLDLIATCAELLEVALPPDAGEDSVSFFPALLGKDTAPLREALVHQSFRGSFAIRRGDWKLNLCPGSGGWSDPRPGRAALDKLPKYQLYDLHADPGETRNLIDDHPTEVQALESLLTDYIQRGRSTPGTSQANDVDIAMVKPIPRPNQK